MTGSVETFTEWRVTGEPGEGFPSFLFIWSKYVGTDHQDPESAAREFMRMRANGSPWRRGPFLSKRTVTFTNWEDA